jgi:hypothetical protein
VKPASSSVAPATSSVAPVKALTFVGSTIDIVAGKAVISVTGTAEGYTAAELKWAWAVRDGAKQSGQPDGAWLYGSETPADADFKAEYVTFNTETKAFTAKLNLSDIAESFVGGSGIYAVYGGPKDAFGTIVIPDAANVLASNVKDSVNKYYYRADMSVLAIAVVELPPMELTEAVVYAADAPREGYWVKIGGTKAGAFEQADFDALEPFIRFQEVGGSWGFVNINVPTSKNPDKFFFSIEGEKAYLNVRIDDLKAGVDYNSHINIKTFAEGDCKMETNLGKFYEAGDKTIMVFSKVGASQQADFWGNLALRVSHADTAYTMGEPVAPVADTSSGYTQGTCEHNKRRWNLDLTAGSDLNGKLVGGQKLAANNDEARFVFKPEGVSGNVNVVLEIKIAPDLAANLDFGFRTGKGGGSSPITLPDGGTNTVITYNDRSSGGWNPTYSDRTLDLPTETYRQLGATAATAEGAAVIRFFVTLRNADNILKIKRLDSYSPVYYSISFIER